MKIIYKNQTYSDQEVGMKKRKKNKENEKYL